VFAFTDQVINRDLKKAYPTLSHLMEEGTVPLVLLSMLVRHYRILLKVHDGLARRLPSAQLGGYAGVPPFLIQRYTDQAKKINMAKCRTSLKRLQKLDKEFKSTGLSNKILLEQAILKL
jgi:DNA polymerase-3 subunit delta